jgi:hypothetical protein
MDTLTANPTNILLSLVIIIMGAKSLWQYLTEKNKSKEKVDLKKLDIEQAGRDYTQAVFKEYQEKVESFKTEIIEDVHTLKQQNAVLIQKIDRLFGYITAMYNIAKKNISDPKLVEIVDDLHEQAQQINTNTQNKPK